MPDFREISRDTKRRRALVWMLHQTGLSYAAIGTALGMSRARAGELGATYERMLEYRRRAAKDWPEPFARRLRAAGAIP